MAYTIPTERNTYENANNDSNIVDYFQYLNTFKDVQNYKLMRGVPDFGSLVQFNPYETGYAVFIIVQMPRFIEELAKRNTGYASLVGNWRHIIEYEFKSFDGLDSMSADTIQLGDDLNNINVINKVNMQAASEFSMVYDEKSGTPMTKFAKLYLTGLKDPRTQVKTYHGLIHQGILEPGFENEVFSFLFINTDNTMRNVEFSTLIVGAQLNSADTDMFTYTKGDIGKRDVTVKFSGYPLISTEIDRISQKFIEHLISENCADRYRINISSMNYDYTGIDNIAKTYNTIVSEATGGDKTQIDPKRNHVRDVVSGGRYVPLNNK